MRNLAYTPAEFGPVVTSVEGGHEHAGEREDAHVIGQLCRRAVPFMEPYEHRFQAHIGRRAVAGAIRCAGFPYMQNVDGLCLQFLLWLGCSRLH